jgi:hypothetical protein
MAHRSPLSPAKTGDTLSPIFTLRADGTQALIHLFVVMVSPQIAFFSSGIPAPQNSAIGGSHLSCRRRTMDGHHGLFIQDTDLNLTLSPSLFRRRFRTALFPPCRLIRGRALQFIPVLM